MGADCKNLFKIAGSVEDIHTLRGEVISILKTGCDESILSDKRIRKCDILFYGDTFKTIVENDRILWVSVETNKDDMSELLAILSQDKDLRVELCATNDEADKFAVMKIRNGRIEFCISTEYVHDTEGLDEFLAIVEKHSTIPVEKLIWAKILKAIS